MKKALDNFSKQADVYKKFRPTYPNKLYQELLRHVANTDRCWDCGTGNGQVAMVLSEYFEAVCATDLSASQINSASTKANISYTIERAESTHFEENTFDLITVAQAAHWFDFDAFNQEVKRVAKNNAILGIWGYGLLRINPTIDALIDEFYLKEIGPYWDSERGHIDTAYEAIPFPFELLQTPKDLAINVCWGLQHLQGYFNSWSSVRHYMEKNGHKNPVPEFIEQLSKVWGAETARAIRFPIFMKMGRVCK